MPLTQEGCTVKISTFKAVLGHFVKVFVNLFQLYKCTGLKIQYENIK